MKGVWQRPKHRQRAGPERHTLLPAIQFSRQHRSIKQKRRRRTSGSDRSTVIERDLSATSSSDKKDGSRREDR